MNSLTTKYNTCRHSLNISTPPHPLAPRALGARHVQLDLTVDLSSENPPRSNPQCSNPGTFAQAFASSSFSYGDYPSRVSHHTVHDIHRWVGGKKKIDSSPQRCPQRPHSLVLQLSVNTQSTTTQLKLNMPFNSQSRSPPLGGLTLRSIPVPREVPDNTVNSYSCTGLLYIPRDSLPCPAETY